MIIKGQLKQFKKYKENGEKMKEMEMVTMIPKGILRGFYSQ